MGYFRTLKVYIIANSLCAKVSFGKLLIHLGGAQTLTFFDIYTKWTRLLPLPTQRNSNKIVTLARRVFPVMSDSFRTCTEIGDHGAKVIRSNSITV